MSQKGREHIAGTYIPPMPSYAKPVSKVEEIKPTLIIEVNVTMSKEQLTEERERIMNEYGGNVVMLNAHEKLVNNVQISKGSHYKIDI